MNDSDIKQDLNITFSSEEGKRVLSYLCHICGYHESSLVQSPSGEINLVSTAHNESRRSVYIALRKLIRADIVNESEKRIEKWKSAPVQKSTKARR